MSTFFLYVGRVAIIGLIIGVLAGFPWPDITPYLTLIGTTINYMYYFNPIFPVTELLLVTTAVLTIEMSLFTIQLIISIANFIGSGHWSWGQKHVEYAGEGAIGGDSYVAKSTRPPGL